MNERIKNTIKDRFDSKLEFAQTLVGLVKKDKKFENVFWEEICEDKYYDLVRAFTKTHVNDITFDEIMMYLDLKEKSTRFFYDSLKELIENNMLNTDYIYAGNAYVSYDLLLGKDIVELLKFNSYFKTLKEEAWDNVKDVCYVRLSKDLRSDNEMNDFVEYIDKKLFIRAEREVVGNYKDRILKAIDKHILVSYYYDEDRCLHCRKKNISIMRDRLSKEEIYFSRRISKSGVEYLNIPIDNHNGYIEIHINNDREYLLKSIFAEQQLEQDIPVKREKDLVDIIKSKMNIHTCNTATSIFANDEIILFKGKIEDVAQELLMSSKEIPEDFKKYINHMDYFKDNFNYVRIDKNLLIKRKEKSLD